MTTEKKQQQVENFTQLINDAEAAISINYVGLTVSQQQELRDELRKTGAQFRVIKNTLFKIATKNSGKDVFLIKTGVMTVISGRWVPPL